MFSVISFQSIPREPDAENGLRRPSQIMVDKLMTIRWEKMSSQLGKMHGSAMLAAEQRLTLFLGLA